MSPDQIEKLAQRLLSGELSVSEFAGRLGSHGHPSIADVGEAQLDLDRGRRCGFPEVVFAQGKSVAAMEKIFHAPDGKRRRRAGHADVARAGGRVGPEIPQRDVQRGGANVPHPASRRGGRQAGSRGGASGRVTVVTAGTSDLPVAEEARETALWTGAEVELIQDVGVAGPHRLAANLGPLASGRRRGRGGRHGGGAAQRGGRPRGLPGDRRADQRRLRRQLRRTGGACWACSTVARPTSRSSTSTPASKAATSPG